MEKPTEQSPPDVHVDPAEVNALLAGGTADIKQGVPLNLKPDDLGLAVSSPGPAAGEKKEVPTDPTFNPAAPTDGVVTRKALIEQTEIDPKLLELTEEEKKIFLKAVLTDAPAALDIALPGLPDTPIVLRTRNNYEQSAIYAALEVETSGRANTIQKYLTWLQFYALAFQLERFGKEVFPGLSYEQPPKNKEQMVAEMNAYVEEHFLGLSVVKTELLITAARIFEAKMTAAVSAMVNRDFSQPAG